MNLELRSSKTIFLKIFVLLALFSTFAYCAGEFSQATNIVSQADMNGKRVLGTIIRWVFALVLPIVCLVAGSLMAYLQQKKKAEQDQNPNKIYWITAAGALIGFFVYVIIAMLISQALFGNMSYAFQVIYNFWMNAVGSGV